MISEMRLGNFNTYNKCVKRSSKRKKNEYNKEFHLKINHIVIISTATLFFSENFKYSVALKTNKCIDFY